ncbi:phenylalanine--tRNA ligase subunit alpha [Candidatus Cyanaurora vandensis]|uniref:phenylalanine--tRNA ligase subunit alpha n=1 Tax=Candidatus Cyanaurora vandensis TaxID=2714958 RepID=UPI00257FD704|nr:phenylalanine--tRNA ligase subunit alpha [Candidatus Cyanaurora vandensis]
MQAQLTHLQTQALTAINASDSLEQIEQLRVRYLGKKGELSAVLGGMGKLAAAERPLVGAMANTVKEQIESALQQQRTHLETQAIQAQLAREAVDVTMPGRFVPQGHRHPMQQTIDRVTDFFIGLGFSQADGPHVETDYYNFEALNFPPDHPAQDMHDTLYLADKRLLRTHTSSVQIRYMETHDPPVRIVVPGGRVYRKDALDATHSPNFHQIEILAVDDRITLADLKGILVLTIEELLGKRPMRFRPSYFPFTEPSVEVDIWWEAPGKPGRWMEVLGAGMVHPNVLKHVGYDPEQVQGFAAGLGVERLTMLLYGIDDIRLLYTSEKRFLAQF